MVTNTPSYPLDQSNCNESDAKRAQEGTNPR
jgi:hypothetical protein